MSENIITPKQILHQLKDIEPLLRTLDKDEENLSSKSLKHLVKTLREVLSHVVYTNLKGDLLNEKEITEVKRIVDR